MPKRLRIAALIAILATSPISSPVWAQDTELPYWASIDTDEARMRRGPGEQFPIEWVYTRERLPVRVVRLLQGWRYVEEPDGTMGWISGGLLSRERTAIVTGTELAPMREEPSGASGLKWNLEPGVIGLLGDCENEWCELDVDGHVGWVEQSRLWGDGEP